ncbi:MAG: hypothetical protein LBE37_20390 [Sphingobacterium sp.]|jgi:plasmid maintenance system antidote protein VapI|nr:hypothetical protein [Sphingobacterium sp.]
MVNWKSNLANALKEIEAQELSARTGIPIYTVRAITSMTHDHLTCEEFILLKLFLKKTHLELLGEIFGIGYFDSVEKIKIQSGFTELGQIISKKYHFGKLPKKELANALEVAPTRIDYLLLEKKGATHQDDNIRIDEISRLEKAFGEELGTLCYKKFGKVKLNNDKEYEKALKEIRKFNNDANSRRKPKEDKSQGES